MAKPIMIQGTMSNVGKSVLCRRSLPHLEEDGYKTAPLNLRTGIKFYITKRGLGDGRRDNDRKSRIKPRI